MTHVMVNLFNIILDIGIVPSERSIYLLCPIYKNIKTPDNYRGITLLSRLSKICSSCIHCWLSFYLEEYNLLGEPQAGFRSRYSTLYIHTILYLSTTRKHSISSKHLHFGRYFLSHNINGKLFNIIHTMYSSAKAYKHFLNTKENLFTRDVGLCKSDNLSPLLFSIYLNDVELGAQSTELVSLYIGYWTLNNYYYYYYYHI